MSEVYLKFFYGERHQILTYFKRIFFPAGIGKSCSKNGSRRIRGHPPAEIFENLRNEMSFEELFEQFLRQALF